MTTNAKKNMLENCAYHAEVKIEDVFRGPSITLEGTLGLVPISKILESER